MTRDLVLAELSRVLPADALPGAEAMLSNGGDLDTFFAEHTAAIVAAFPDRGATLLAEIAAVTVAALPAEVANALAVCRAYIARVDAGTRGEYAPHVLCGVIATNAARLPYPDATAELLLELLNAAGRIGYREYEGQDLQNMRPVVDAIGAVARLPEKSVPVLASILRRSTDSAYHAAPGSPDVDKYDRDQDVESAQDEIARSAAAALARFREHAAPALETLDAATTHRNRRVAALAKDVAKAIRYYTS